jgi:SAM-dependent methyltransferase
VTVQAFFAIAMTDISRANVRQLSTDFYDRGDYTGWFEALYAQAEGNLTTIPWADCAVNPWLVEWLQQRQVRGENKSCLVIGCGLGDDAEDLAGLGFQVTAFDISPTAIDWCQQRFPNSKVNYQVADLFNPPSAWHHHFDLVIEIYTIQALPAQIRPDAIAKIGSFVADRGNLVVICRGRNPEDSCENLPFPLTQSELTAFELTGLQQIGFEDFIDPITQSTPTRRFRVTYQRSG